MSLQPNEIATILHGEYQRVQGKAAATDSAFLSYLSIGVTPFLAFTAYAVAERKFQIFLAALPILSVLGMMVVVILATHYVYAGAYLEYLECRINGYIGKQELRDSHFARDVYKTPTSPVIISYVIALTVLLAMNVCAVPAINVFLLRFQATHQLPPVYRNLLLSYWCIVVPFVAVAVAVLAFSLARASKRVQHYKGEAIEVMCAHKTNHDTDVNGRPRTDL